MSSGETTARGPGVHAPPAAPSTAPPNGADPGDGTLRVQLVDLRSGAAVGGRAQLRIPAEARSLRLARLVVAGVAADAGFTVDDVEDLRVAVDEACAAVMSPVGDVVPDHVQLAVDVEELAGVRRVEVAVWSEPAVAPLVDPVPALLLEHTTDGWVVDGDQLRLWRSGTVTRG